MSNPFRIEEYVQTIEINGKIGIGEDGSSSIAFGLLSQEVDSYEHCHRWIRSERISLVEAAETLGCIVRDVQYKLAVAMGYVWHTPCSFILEKDGFLLQVEQIPWEKRKSDLGISWQIKELKHNCKSKTTSKLIQGETKLIYWNNLHPDIRRQIVEQQRQESKNKKKEAWRNHVLYGEPYDWK